MKNRSRLFSLYRETSFAGRGRERQNEYGLERHTESEGQVGCDGDARYSAGVLRTP